MVGLLASAATPKPIVDRIHAEVRKIVTNPAFAAWLKEQGLIGIANTPAEFAEPLKREQEKWALLIKGRQLKLDWRRASVGPALTLITRGASIPGRSVRDEGRYAPMPRILFRFP